MKLGIFVEYVIFFSYTIISAILFYIYLRHVDRVDTRTNRLLMITSGLFLMLCALTHLYSTWYHDKNIYLSSSCAIVSFIASVCSLYSFRDLDEYLSLRIHTKDIIRDQLVKNLKDGYDLHGVFQGTEMVQGYTRNEEITNPVPFTGELVTKSIITIGSDHYRITNMMESSVDIDPHRRRFSIQSPSFYDYESPLSRSFVVFGYDATAEVHMANEQERMNSARMSMCMSTAHDVRTPLSSLGIVISCLQSMGNRDENLVEYDRLLEEAYVNVEMINLIITQFMDIGKMDTTIDIRPTICVMDMETIQDRVTKIGNRLKGENVEFSVEMSKCTPVSVFSDVEWVWQILLNLVSNAIKYTYNGYVRVTLSHDGENLVIEVRDTGIGIDDSDKEDIFGKFVTYKNFGHDSHGIGLYSVKTKVDSLDGCLEVVDNPGGGSVFSVKIPSKVNSELDSYDSNGNMSSRKRCLVVDDTPSIRKMVTRLLRNHDVETACNGAVGLEMMKSNEYDLVLLDMFMPVMDGLECIRRFREWESVNRDLRQVIYSMSANQHTLDDSFDGSIPKPIDGKRLGMIIERL